jgi:C-terminal processing protease CtpA/Prc
LIENAARITEFVRGYDVLMVRWLAVFIFAAATLPCQAQDGSELAAILSFEAPHPQSCPAGWFCDPLESVNMDSAIVHGGNWSVRIERQPGTPKKLSGISKSIPIDFRGTTLELHGFLRTENVENFCAFWMREDGISGNVAFVSMQGTQPATGTTPWTEYKISLPVKPEARELFFGFLLDGPGKAWADDLQLLVDKKPAWEAPKVERPKTALDTDHEFDDGSRVTLDGLTKNQIKNLATLGKVWGFLKYYHPQVVSGHRHFDYDLFRAMPSVLAAVDRDGANAVMLRWINELGEVGTCSPSAKLDEHELHLRPDLDWISDKSRLGLDLSKTLRRIYDNRSVDGKQFYVSLKHNVGNPSFDHEPDYGKIHLPDAGFEILALFRFWNIIEYWSPYRNVMEEDWDAVLTEFLPRTALAKDRDAYELQLIALVARVHDTHANLWGSLGVRPPTGACQVPVNIRFVENQAVIASYSDAAGGKANGLEPGDVIQRLDGVEIGKLIRDWRPYYAASNEPTRLRDIGRYMTRGDCAKPAALRVLRGNKTLDLLAARVRSVPSDNTANHDQAGDTFRRLSKDVAYLKLSSVKAADATRYIDSAAGTKGLIIDIRNYPSEFVVYALGQLLFDKETEFVRFTHSDMVNPGAFHWGEPLSLPPRTPHYQGKVVILIDEVSQSRAEYTTMEFRAAPDAFVVGSTTAGADGDVSQIPLPGGLKTMISGIGIFYPDKKPTQRIGIIPDEEVKPTIAGIRDGRDEVLEAAIRHVLGPDTPAAVIVEMARPPKVAASAAAEFKDDASGISWKIPEGWGARDPLHWGDRQNTVFFTGPPNGSVFALYFQVLHAPVHLTESGMAKALHDDAEAKQLQRRREGRSDYAVRRDSLQTRIVSGHPALSYIADFNEDGHGKAEYFTFVRTDKLIVFLFGNVPTADLDAFRKSFDRMIDTISIP